MFSLIFDVVLIYNLSSFLEMVYVLFICFWIKKYDVRCSKTFQSLVS